MDTHSTGSGRPHDDEVSLRSEAVVGSAGTGDDAARVRAEPAPDTRGTRRPRRATRQEGQAEPGDAPVRGSGPPTRTVALAGAVLVVAVAALAASVVYAVHSFGAVTPVSASADRDSAVAAARSVAATMTTVKGGDPDATLKAWQGVITGGLADQYAKQEPQLKQRIQQSTGSVSSAVTNAALSEFNHAAGTAAALVFVDTTLADPKAAPPASAAPSAAQPAPSAQPGPSGQPAPSAQPGNGAQPGAAPGAAEPQKQRLALTMSLNRTAQGWKASDLTPVDPAKVGR